MLRHLIAGALLAALAFGATRVSPNSLFGVEFAELLKFLTVALALILVGEVIRQIFNRLGWAQTDKTPSLGMVVDFGLAVLVLGFLTIAMLLGSR